MILNKGRWKAAVWHVAFKVLSISFHGMQSVFLALITLLKMMPDLQLVKFLYNIYSLEFEPRIPT